MKLFALQSSHSFGELISKELHLPLSVDEEREFEDGEYKCRSLENVRNEEVFVIDSLHSDSTQSVQDKLCRLLFFIGSLKDASAKKVTAIVPYLCYGRKDRKTKPRDPVTTRYIARLFEAVGTDSIITMDVHNVQAFQNSFNIPAENLEAAKIFVGYLAPILAWENAVIMSPDFGGIKRVEQYQQRLKKYLGKELPVAFMEKYRSGDVVSGEMVAGEVKDKTVVIIDDLISTGGTLARAAAACSKAGSKKVLAIATHGLFTGNAASLLAESALEQIIIINTILDGRLEPAGLKEKITVLNAAPLFAKAIQQSYEGGSISQLLQE